MFWVTWANINIFFCRKVVNYFLSTAEFLDSKQCHPFLVSFYLFTCYALLSSICTLYSQSGKITAVTETSYILGFKFSGKACLQADPRNSLGIEWFMPSPELLTGLSLDNVVHHWGCGWGGESPNELHGVMSEEEKRTARGFKEKQMVVTIYLKAIGSSLWVISKLCPEVLKFSCGFVF